MSYLYVPGLPGSTLESGSPPTDAPEPSVSWNGKRMSQRSWSRAWAKHSWLRLLSGPTSPPSTVGHGAALWIASLQDTHASRSLTPGSVLALMTPGTSGPMSPVSYGEPEQLGLFSRTFPAICPLGSMKSAGNFSIWVTQLRQAYSARLRLALRIAGRDSLRWPTATTMDTMDAERAGIVGNHNLSLPVAAGQWLTPGANEDAAGRPGAEMQPQIKQQAETWALGLSDQTGTGDPYQNDSGPRRLNPVFVEWLMGLPLGWTDFAPVGTEWSRWWQLMRSELSRLPWLDA